MYVQKNNSEKIIIQTDLQQNYIWTVLLQRVTGMVLKRQFEPQSLG